MKTYKRYPHQSVTKWDYLALAFVILTMVFVYTRVYLPAAWASRLPEAPAKSR
jgi:hypothetical protein